MAPTSCVKEGGLAHCGTQGSTSSIDHFLIPKEAKRLLGKVRVCWRLERAIQLASCQLALDHMPLPMELHHTFGHKGGQMTGRTAWNPDKRAAALQTVKGREEFGGTSLDDDTTFLMAPGLQQVLEFGSLERC